VSENKFIVEDATDVICIGGFGNDLGNKELLKYSEEEIKLMILENNITQDNIRLANSLLRTIRNQENIIKEVREYIERYREQKEKLQGVMLCSNKLLEILEKEK
jgi:hypothetical protein